MRSEVIELRLEVTELKIKLQESEDQRMHKEAQKEASVQDQMSIQRFHKELGKKIKSLFS